MPLEEISRWQVRKWARCRARERDRLLIINLQQKNVSLKDQLQKQLEQYREISHEPETITQYLDNRDNPSATEPQQQPPFEEFGGLPVDPVRGSSTHGAVLDGPIANQLGLKFNLHGYQPASSCTRSYYDIVGTRRPTIDNLSACMVLNIDKYEDTDGEGNNNEGNNNNEDNNAGDDDLDNGDNNLDDNDDNDDNDALDADGQKPNGKLAGIKNVLKKIVEDSFGPIKEKIEKFEEKVLKVHKKEEVDVGKLLEPLASKFDNVRDKVEAVRSSSAGLKDKMNDIQDSIEGSSDVTKNIKGEVDTISKTAEQTQKDAAGLKAGISKTAKDLKQLSGSMTNSLGNVASKDDVKKAALAIKGGIKETVNDAANSIKGEVQEVLQKSAGSPKDIHKTVQKNQKYLKRIYKDLHHR